MSGHRAGISFPEHSFELAQAGRLSPCVPGPGTPHSFQAWLGASKSLLRPRAGAFTSLRVPETCCSVKVFCREGAAGEEGEGPTEAVSGAFLRMAHWRLPLGRRAVKLSK